MTGEGVRFLDVIPADNTPASRSTLESAMLYGERIISELGNRSPNDHVSEITRASVGKDRWAYQELHVGDVLMCGECDGWC